jgi:hypothetical protein
MRGGLYRFKSGPCVEARDAANFYSSLPVALALPSRLQLSEPDPNHGKSCLISWLCFLLVIVLFLIPLTLHRDRHSVFVILGSFAGVTRCRM